MSKKHVEQKSLTVSATASSPSQLCAIPKGFRGYVRVKVYSVTAAAQVFGAWVRATSEGLISGSSGLNATNAGALWVVNDEKLWLFPLSEMTLIAFASTADCVAYVDVAGEIEDDR